MNVDLHTVLPAIILRKFKMEWVFVLAAAIGGLLPDAVSAVEHLFYWFGWIDHKWVWRNWFHFADQGMWPIVIAFIVSGTVTAPFYKSGLPICMALSIIFGYLMHIGIDYLWHPAGGGWYAWGFYVDMLLRVAYVFFFTYHFIASGLSFKQYIRTL